jgi:hypothetical protein
VDGEKKRLRDKGYIMKAVQKWAAFFVGQLLKGRGLNKGKTINHPVREIGILQLRGIRVPDTPRLSGGKLWFTGS